MHSIGVLMQGLRIRSPKAPKKPVARASHQCPQPRGPCQEPNRMELANEPTGETRTLLARLRAFCFPGGEDSAQATRGRVGAS